MSNDDLIESALTRSQLSSSDITAMLLRNNPVGEPFSPGADVDVIVVCSDASEIAPDSVRHVAGLHGAVRIQDVFARDRRVDVEFWSLEQVKDLEHLFSGVGNDGVTAQLQDDDLDAATGLVISTPLIPSAGVITLIASLRVHLPRVAMSHYEALYDSIQQDARGLLAINRKPLTAAMMAREAFGVSLDALLTSRLRHTVKPKWRLEWIERVFPEHARVSWEVLSCTQLEKPAARTWAASTLEEADALWAQL